MSFNPHMRLDSLTAAARSKVEFEIHLWQSVVDYLCISYLSVNIYYYFELWPTKFN